eukprot:5063481-Pyramimonas_sp.AAC.1
MAEDDDAVGEFRELLKALKAPSKTRIRQLAELALANPKKAYKQVAGLVGHHIRKVCYATNHRRDGSICPRGTPIAGGDARTVPGGIPITGGMGVYTRKGHPLQEGQAYVYHYSMLPTRRCGRCWHKSRRGSRGHRHGCYEHNINMDVMVTNVDVTRVFDARIIGIDMDGVGTAVDLGAIGVDVDVTSIEADVVGLDVDAKGTDVDAKGTDVDDKGADVDAKGTDVDDKGTDVDAKGTDVDDKGTDVDAKGTDVRPFACRACRRESSRGSA